MFVPNQRGYTLKCTQSIVDSESYHPNHRTCPRVIPVLEQIAQLTTQETRVLSQNEGHLTFLPGCGSTVPSLTG